MGGLGSTNTFSHPHSDKMAAPPPAPPRLLVLGLACQDTIGVVEKYPARDTKNHTAERHVTGGGNGANVAVALSRLGASVVFREANDSLNELVNK